MSTQSKPVHILVVDDDAMSRDLLEILLSGEGHRVESVDSGESALTLLTQSHSAPQVVLADVQLPGISGRHLAKALRSQCGPATVLLAMSGSSPPKDAVSSFDGFLLKPFSMQQVADMIASATVAASAASVASNPVMNGALHQVEPHLGTGSKEEDADRIQALDERIYKQLAEAMPVTQLHRMYSMCVSDSRDRIAVMRRLAEQHDATQFCRQAHAIKGGCGMLGATELYMIAERLESSGPDPEMRTPEWGVNRLDELVSACDRLERILGSRL
jgi:CheY-like chemotaxis protein/HPt (histidine-containing phosphotransfer) domain-containing protein